MMRPITKYATSIVSGAKIPSILQNAFKLARSERPGAVAIELPEDIAAEEVDISQIPRAVERVRRPNVDEKIFLELIDHLEKAKHPILLIGAGANRKRITRYLTEFIVQHHIPFFCSQMGK